MRGSAPGVNIFLLLPINMLERLGVWAIVRRLIQQLFN